MTSYVGSIDEGTSSARFILYNQDGKEVSKAQKEFPLITPHPGWVEQDATVVLETVRWCMEEACKKAKVSASDVKAIGITNQRETTIIWDRKTGVPLANAIVWQDLRTTDTVAKWKKKWSSSMQKKTGLPLSTYFSGMKVRWLMDNNPEIAKAVASKSVMFGTIDTWLVWNLTGGVNGGHHVTDVTNASRTLFMDIAKCAWDPKICALFDIPIEILPEIRSSSEVYGKVASGALEGVPVAGILGDQQSALVGQAAFSPGEAKNTYGTGCFMLYNTGVKPVISKNGLLTTVAYKFGDAPPVYALEGSISVAGAGIKWLRDQLGIIKTAPEAEELAKQVEDNGGVYVVPAFSGLFAPHWRSDARGIITGLTAYSSKHHIARAMLESVTYRTREILEAMEKDSKVKMAALKVDGGMTHSKMMLQMQADMLGIDVLCPENIETTAFGAAYAAAVAVGMWKHDVKAEPIALGKITAFSPTMPADQRAKLWAGWNVAVKKSYGLA